jgi:hypothetical protein
LHSICCGNFSWRISAFEWSGYNINILSDNRAVGSNRLTPATHSYSARSCIVSFWSRLILLIGLHWKKTRIDGWVDNFLCYTFSNSNWLLHNLRPLLRKDVNNCLLLHIYHHFITYSRTCFPAIHTYFQHNIKNCMDSKLLFQTINRNSFNIWVIWVYISDIAEPVIFSYSMILLSIGASLAVVLFPILTKVYFNGNPAHIIYRIHRHS